MKIRKLTQDNYPKVSALLRRTFPGSNYEVKLFENLHRNEKKLYEWACIHRSKIIAYIAFSHAFDGEKECGLHLAPLAVTPEMQNQGIGSELLTFSLRQDILKEKTIFVLGEPSFYQKFGFELSLMPKCPFDKNNDHFLSLRNTTSTQFTIGYEPEFRLNA